MTTSSAGMCWPAVTVTGLPRMRAFTMRHSQGKQRSSHCQHCLCEDHTTALRPHNPNLPGFPTVTSQARSPSQPQHPYPPPTHPRCQPRAHMLAMSCVTATMRSTAGFRTAATGISTATTCTSPLTLLRYTHGRPYPLHWDP